MKIIDIKNNCILPFSGMQIDTDGRISPCCMYKNEFDPEHKIYKIDEYHEYWTVDAPRIQKEFLNGGYAKGCDTCFDTENDITSDLRYNSTKNYSEFYQTETPQWLDLRFGNYCNLKCIMCHGNLSSQIHLEQHANYEKFDLIGINPVEFKQLAWWDDPEIFGTVLGVVKQATYISFSGGEPLLNKQLYQILDAADPNVVISFNTNLTSLTDKHIEAFKKFKTIIIQVSLDGTNQHHEYIRYGSKWPVIEDNIFKLLKFKNIKVGITYLLQHTSIYTFPDFYSFVKQFSHQDVHKIGISTVYSQSVGGQDMMTINSVLPEEVDRFRQWIVENLNDYQDIICQWLDMYKFNPVAHQKFKDYVLLLDQLRGCNFRDTFNPNW